MSALLQTRGPVSTCNTVTCNWRFLRTLSQQQFQEAAVELDQRGLGNAVLIQSKRGRTPYVFVKKAPAEVQSLLAANMGLCDFAVYKARYGMPAPKTLSWHVRSKLVDMGLVSKTSFM